MSREWCDDPWGNLAKQDPSGEVRRQWCRIWDELGGPAQLRTYRPIPDEEPFFNLCCRFPLANFDGLIIDAAKDEELRWWPNLALATAQLRGASRSAEKTKDVPLSGMEALLRRISEACNSIKSDCVVISDLADLTRSPAEWMKAELFRKIQVAINEAGGGIMVTPVALFSFQAEVQRQADHVAKLDPKDYRSGAERIPGLHNLIMKVGFIWKDLRGRLPSAEKVTRKDGEANPPFVRAIRGIAHMAEAYPPTPDQVAKGISVCKELGFWETE